MKTPLLAALGAPVLLLGAAGPLTPPPARPGTASGKAPPPVVAATHPVLARVRARPAAPPVATPASRAAALPALNGVIQRSCAGCHSDQRRQGNLSLQAVDLATVATVAPEVAEKMIGKLRTGMMPPPGRARPGGDTLQLLAETLERFREVAVRRAPNPGRRTFQRLNRAEYERAIRDLLALDVNAEAWLPLDTRSANFDNIADVQLPSATVLEAYLDAASAISRLAVGDPQAAVSTATYKVPRLANQVEPAPGAPAGTRGGISVTHVFPADGEYVFHVNLHSTPIGQLVGSNAPFDEVLEFSVDGERVAAMVLDRGMHESEPAGLDLRTAPVRVKAGPHRIAAAFVRTFEGPVNDNMAPIGNSLPDTQIGIQDAITIQGHVKVFTVTGPTNPTGVSDTPSRRRIFGCRPLAPAEQRPCAERIVRRLATEAYRRPLATGDVAALMAFYDEGAAAHGFEGGVRAALEAVLASPHFVFRTEALPAAARPGTLAPVGAVDLASRLSFFLWGAPPDSALLAAARTGRLADTTVLLAQARRLLADPRSDALATRFAAQWLRLQDVDKVHPDPILYPDFNLQLAQDAREETERFMAGLVRENRSLLELLTADYTWANERLARHYGIPDVAGEQFRRVAHAEPGRRGLLGHTSVLLLTSLGNRTSPVLRGKWVMEVLLGSPPPPPPPNVPDLEATAGDTEGRRLTTRERMEQHRANPSCRSCHAVIDPIGLALDNFDVTGRWRIREHMVPLDTRGTFYDGTPVTGPADLQQALLRRPIPLARSFVANLMAYATGRRIEAHDGPAVRRVEGAARARQYRLHDLILGVVRSEPFRFRMVPASQAVRPASGAVGALR
ncbi:MAG: DUF1592 domain-containing protein [Gemmatimonadetes bacterium]|nr:DUF1592 domain-containing protein [Gemmatimonadota bacterium]